MPDGIPLLWSSPDRSSVLLSGARLYFLDAFRHCDGYDAYTSRLLVPFYWACLVLFLRRIELFYSRPGLESAEDDETGEKKKNFTKINTKIIEEGPFS